MHNFKKYLSNINRDDIIRATRLIKETVRRGSNVFVIGNGGSIATAIHFTEDLMLNNDYRIKAHNLSNISVLTAISNDWGYEDVYLKQLENLYADGDLLVTISASGNSSNLVKAIDYVKKNNGRVISISSFHGGVTKRKADIPIYVRSDVGSYEITEDIHLVICHMISKLLKEDLE